MTGLSLSPESTIGYTCLSCGDDLADEFASCSCDHPPETQPACPQCNDTHQVVALGFGRSLPIERAVDGGTEELVECPDCQPAEPAATFAERVWSVLEPLGFTRRLMGAEFLADSIKEKVLFGHPDGFGEVSATLFKEGREWVSCSMPLESLPAFAPALRALAGMGEK